MKFAKKLMSVLLVVLMLVTMALPAMADTPITITLENVPANHTYAAYQIFKGTLHDGILTEIEWGNGVNGASLLSALKVEPHFGNGNENLFSSSNDAAAVATVIAGWPYNETNIRKFADVVSNFLGTEAKSGTVVDSTPFKLDVTSAGTGYYLIKDITDAPGVAGATDYLLQVVGPTTVAIKSSQPTFTKMVNNTKEGTYAEFVDSEVSDFTIADDDLATSNVVWFKLEATLPSLFNYYNQYYLKFEDVVPAGLDPIEGSSSGNIYIQHESGTKTTLTARNVSVVGNGNGTSNVTLDLENIKTQLSGVTLNLNDTIVIKYAARVIPDAILGNGTESDYGNKNVAKMIFSADMNETVSEDYKTAELTDDAHVFTYQATFTKVDSATKTPLAGAEFVLYRNRTEGSSLVPHYAIVDANGWITDWTKNEAEATKLVSSTVTQNVDTYTGGSFTVKGLDALSYHLKEVTPPGGYERMEEPILFTINREFDSVNHKLTTVSMTLEGTTVNGAADTGLVTGSINNTKGNILPATGGMGTTIFYIAGAVLLLGSITAFAVKKRGEN